MERVKGLALAGAVLLAAVPAVAQEEGAPQTAEVQEARSRFELAEGHFHEGEYALALEEFERVYELMRAARHPNASYVIYNVAFTNERMGREQAALEAYERFLAESPEEAPNRADATRRLRELRARLELAERDRQVDAPVTEAGGGISPVGVVVAAVGGASLIAGAVLGGVALSNSESARAECVDTRCPESTRAGIADAQTLANVSDGLLFGGLAVAAAGVVLMLVLSEGGGEGPAAGAACTGDGCVAAVGGTF